MNIVIYCPNFGNYDTLPPVLPLGDGPNVRRVCVSDRSCQGAGWESLVSPVREDDTRRQSRHCLILSHRYFPDADVTIMHAGCLQLKVAAEDALEWVADDRDMAAIAHPHRDCIYDEASTVIAMGKDVPENVLPQMARYKAEGYPAHNGLAASTLLVRYNTNAVAAFNEAWWREVQNGSVRDQLSFNYVCWKQGITYSVIPGNLTDSPSWYWGPHG